MAATDTLFKAADAMLRGLEMQTRADASSKLQSDTGRLLLRQIAVMIVAEVNTREASSRQEVAAEMVNVLARESTAEFNEHELRRLLQSSVDALLGVP